MNDQIKWMHSVLNRKTFDYVFCLALLHGTLALVGYVLHWQIYSQAVSLEKR